jgi:hypothetical protein
MLFEKGRHRLAVNARRRHVHAKTVHGDHTEREKHATA